MKRTAPFGDYLGAEVAGIWQGTRRPHAGIDLLGGEVMTNRRRSLVILVVVAVVAVIAVILMQSSTLSLLRRSAISLARGAITSLEKAVTPNYAPFEAPRLIPTPTATFQSGPVILDAIQTHAKVESVSMVFANDQDESKKWGLEVLGTGACQEGITYLGYYTVTAGLDLRSINQSDILVTNDGNPAQAMITITLPTAAILHVERDSQRSRVVHKDAPVISQLCGTKLSEMVLEAQVKIAEYARNAALEKGILRMAQEQAGFNLQRLLFSIGFPKVFIQYRES
jgi:hypothetical protein